MKTPGPLKGLYGGFGGSVHTITLINGIPLKGLYGGSGGLAIYTTFY